MSVSRNSRQRDAVLQNLLSRYDHPTAEEVYEDVRKMLPNISLATVYRNLNLLADDGIIRSLITRDAIHFDAHNNNHRHVICNCCGKIFDIDFFPVDTLIAEAEKQFDGSIDYCRLIFYGTCDNCKK